MRLTESDYQLFLNANQSLTMYAGKTKQLVPKDLTLLEYRSTLPGKKIMECAEVFYKNPSILKDFLRKNPDGLSSEHLEVARQFKDFIKGDFFIYKYLTDYTVFIKDNLAYGVLALSDPFQSFFGNQLPTYAQTVLLPFKDKIVYHGFLLGGRIHFGSGYKRSLNDVYKTAKAQYGIITTLPFDGKTIYERKSPPDQLAYFLKTKANREEFENDIQRLIQKYPELLPQYHQTWGKINAPSIKKQYKELGLNKAYYALLQGKVISSAGDKKTLEASIHRIVPEHKLEWVYTFRM